MDGAVVEDPPADLQVVQGGERRDARGGLNMLESVQISSQIILVIEQFRITLCLSHSLG